jgi:adenine-specific DNA-methyltransferase
MTEEGDSVFDPYTGVGTTVVAAIKHGRVGYGCDVVQDYIDIAWERIHALRAGVLKTRELGKPVYDPELPYGGHK